MLVRDIMSKRLITAKKKDSLKTAAEIMLKNGVGGLPIVDEKGELVGMVTESDFITKDKSIPMSTERFPQLFGEWVSKKDLKKMYEAASKIPVEQIMTTDVATVKEDDDLADLLDLMQRRDINRVPVVKGKKPISLVARRDLLKLVLTGDG